MNRFQHLKAALGIGITAGGAPRAAVQDSGGGMLINTSQELEEALRNGSLSGSGASVTPNTAMKVAAVYGCVRLISSPIATLPFPIKRRIDDRTRESASDHPAAKILNRKPNSWQTPSQFRRMMQTHQLLRGNGYALIDKYRGQPTSLIPLNPDRMEVKQRDDLSLLYIYQTKNGDKQEFSQDEIFHIYGLTLDGYRGVTPITYARETIGLTLAMENYGSQTFSKGAKVSGTLSHPGRLDEASIARLKDSLDSYRDGGSREHKDLILEEGMKYERMALTADDMQWIDSRKLSRSDIAMFFGVPPHMLGDTEKSTSWGSGIEQQSIGFVTYTLEDYLTMWEETVNRDLLTPKDSDLYAKFNRAGLVKGDIKTRWEAYVKRMQWGVSSPNDIRALEDENPREGGDVYYDPPNTAGGQNQTPEPEPTQ